MVQEAFSENVYTAAQTLLMQEHLDDPMQTTAIATLVNHWVSTQVTEGEWTAPLTLTGRIGSVLTPQQMGVPNPNIVTYVAGRGYIAHMAPEDMTG
jgi:hypothetical protein